MTSSIGGSSNADGVTSDQPMLTLASNKTADSYQHRLQKLARRGKWGWAAFLGLAVLVLAVLICGAVALILTSPEGKSPPSPEITPEKAGLTAPRQKTEMKFKFEYQTADNKIEQVFVNVKENYTELFAENVTVFNHFRRKISLHKIEISPSRQICLVKNMHRELPPAELQKIVSRTSKMEVNSTELYIIDSVPVPEDVKNDITVHKFCDRLGIYPLKLVNESVPDESGLNVGLTMEQLIEQFEEGRYRRQAPLNPLDRHNGGPYHCGGPIGTDVPLPAIQYTCTKEKSYCYRSIVRECDECYHGHNLRTSKCWCPIGAMQTCIKISYKPDKRSCCGVNRYPCVQNECGARIPFLPIPEITVRVITDE